MKRWPFLSIFYIPQKLKKNQEQVTTLIRKIGMLFVKNEENLGYISEKQKD